MAMQDARIGSSRDDLAALLVATGSGNREAFAALYREAAGRVHGATLVLVNDHAAAAELGIRAWLAIWYRAHEYDPQREAALVWMIAMARRIARARLEHGSGPASEGSDGPSMEDVGLLDAIPEPERTMLASAYLRGESHEQLARRCGVSTSAVRPMLRKAILAFAALSPEAVLTPQASSPRAARS